MLSRVWRGFSEAAMKDRNEHIYSVAGLVLLGVIFLGMMGLMRITASQVAQLSGGQGIVDLEFAITPERLRQALSGYGRAAAGYYRWGFLLVDMVYAFAYVTFYRCAIKAVCERCKIYGRAGELLPMVPVVGMLGDLFENTVMFILLGGNRSGVLMWAFTVFNVIKFVLVYASLAVVIGGTLWLVKKRLS